MLHLFLTEPAAVGALATEYERYFSLCRPLMRIFTGQDAAEFRKVIGSLTDAEGDACLSCAMPPLFAMPEKLVNELAGQSGSDALPELWKKSLSVFRKNMKKQRLILTLLDPEAALLTPALLKPPLVEVFSIHDYTYTREQYLAHWERLRALEKQYENLTLTFRSELAGNTLLYVKEDAGVIMAKADAPMAAFVISERNMVNAFWDYLNG